MAFSIIICTYNNDRTLAETLRSLTQVELPLGCPVELVVVDNGSTDETLRICAAILPLMPFPARVVQERERGLSRARNRGIEETRGEVVIFTDDDVLVPRDWLIQYRRAFRCHGADCVFGRILPEWREFRPFWLSDEFRAIFALLDYGPHTILVADTDHEFFGANFGVRRDKLDAVGGFHTSLGRTSKLHIGEETRVYRQLIQNRSTVVYEPAVFVFHVIHKERKSIRYVCRYFRDTAESLVVLDRELNPRAIYGYPLFRIRELVRDVGVLIPGLIRSVLNRKPGLALILCLKLYRDVRVAYLHLFT